MTGNAAYDAYDDALEWLAPYGPDLSWGFTSHAPMVVEALCALGRPDAVLPWLETHREGLQPRPAATGRIEADAWPKALGRAERWADWTALFESELADGAWGEVLARWGERLAPGLAGAATHGLLRTGHAARALAERDTPVRRAELAAGLGYWAATWLALPVAPAPRGSPSGARAALARVPLLAARRPESRSIVDALRSLEAFPEFGPVIHELDVGRPFETVLDELTDCAARVFLANSGDSLPIIVFTHGVTSAVALRSVAPHLPGAPRRASLRFAWQAQAGLVAAYAAALPPPADPVPEAAEPRDALIDAAIASGDEHAVKLTEACLREDSRRPSPLWRLAARRGIDRFARG